MARWLDPQLLAEYSKYRVVGVQYDAKEPVQLVTFFAVFVLPLQAPSF